MHKAPINLVTNAVKYNNNDNPTMQIGTRIVEDHYELRVHDKGPGIKDSDQAFEKFNRGRERSGKYGGSGPGLAISRRIMPRMGGSLDLVESGSEGTRFRVRLSLAAG